MKYITCKTKHYTGEVFVDAMKIADNEVYAIVEADNLEQAREIARSKRYCPICNDYTAHVEDIVDSVSGWKVGETIVCDNCMAGQRDKSKGEIPSDEYFNKMGYIIKEANDEGNQFKH